MLSGSIFYDYNHVFQWGSVAALIALIGAIGAVVFSFLSYRNSRLFLQYQQELAEKKIAADLKAQARIDWLQKMRVLEADFIEDANLYMAHAQQLLEQTIRYVKASRMGKAHQMTQAQTAQQKYLALLEGKHAQIQKTFLIFHLYFGVDLTSQTVIEAARKMQTTIQQAQELIEEAGFSGEAYKQENLEKLQEQLYQLAEVYAEIAAEFVREAREYNAQEWHKAENGE